LTPNFRDSPRNNKKEDDYNRLQSLVGSNSKTPGKISAEPMGSEYLDTLKSNTSF
jgi:hypothetical protein